MPILWLLRRDGRLSRAERALRHVPNALIEYPFETLMAVFGLLSGPAALLGASSPALDALLPKWAVMVWGLWMTLSAAAIAVGLKFRRYAPVLVRGLELFGITCIVWSVAVFAEQGALGGIPGGPLLTLLAVLSWLRTWWLALEAAMHGRIEVESNG